MLKFVLHWRKLSNYGLVFYTILWILVDTNNLSQISNTPLSPLYLGQFSPVRSSITDNSPLEHFSIPDISPWNTLPSWTTLPQTLQYHVLFLVNALLPRFGASMFTRSSLRTVSPPTRRCQVQSLYTPDKFCCKQQLGIGCPGLTHHRCILDMVL